MKHDDELTLFDESGAPTIGASFDGPAFEPTKDQVRLNGQIRRVWQVMSDGNWRSVNQICKLTGDPAPSVLAQLGHLRKAKFGAYLVERRRATESGLYEYRVGGKGEGTPMTKRCVGCEERDAEIMRLQMIIESRVH